MYVKLTPEQRQERREREARRERALAIRATKAEKVSAARAKGRAALAEERDARLRGFRLRD